MSTLVDVIVPVLNRPHNAVPFMESQTDDRVTVHVVSEFDDVGTRAAWWVTSAKVHTSATAHTFAEKVNEGYRHTTAPWVLLAGDDVRFTPGWLDAALEVAEATEAKVIGTNDEANARVKRGTHTCHPLIARDYIDTVGASWDGPGIICHEGYRHTFVDDEIVTAAKRRNVWAPAPLSIVRHLHPVWGTAPLDGTYRLGQSHQDHDRALYRARLERHAS